MPSNFTHMEYATQEVQPEHERSMCSMWEVIGRSRLSGIERNVITDSWPTASRLAKRGLDRGWRITIRQVYRDILIADESGQLVVAAKKLTHKKALEFCHCYSQIDTNRGCVIWPHGHELPAVWNIIR